MVNFGLLAAEIVSLVWGNPANFNGFASWLRYCSYVAHRRPTKLCTMFGRLLGCYIISTLEMWDNAQSDGRPAGHRWRPVFNAAKFG